MKLFTKSSATSKREDRASEDAFNDRLRHVLSRETVYDDAEIVETRLRNMMYGANRR